MLYNDVTGDPLLSGKFAGLNDDETRLAHQALAESLLGLSAPAYTDPVVLATLKIAIVMQINFQLEQSIEPEVLKSQSNTHPGNVTAYRDRYASPKALGIVATVTGRRAVRYEPSLRGA